MSDLFSFMNVFGVATCLICNLVHCLLQQRMNCGFLGISEFDCVGKASCKVTLTLFSGSTAFPYCKWWKAGQSLVTNLKLVIYTLILHTIWISYLPFRAVAMTLKLLLPATMALTLTWIFTSLDMDMVTWEIFATCMVAKVSVSCGITPPPQLENCNAYIVMLWGCFWGPCKTRQPLNSESDH